MYWKIFTYFRWSRVSLLKATSTHALQLLKLTLLKRLRHFTARRRLHSFTITQMHKLVSLILESLSHLHREKQQVMKILCKDFNAQAFFPTAVMLFHLYKFQKSQTSEDDPSSSTGGASFIVGSSFTVRTKTILESL